MRLKFLPALLIVFSAMLFLASCGKKTNTQGRYIPKEAVFVAHLNGESLNTKLPWDEVKNNNAFKIAYTDSSIDAMAKAAMENPENTGMDIKADMVFFVVKDTAGGYVAFQGKVKDAAKLKSYYTATLKDAVASEKDGVQFLTSGRISMSWDKDKFIMVSDLPEMNQMNQMQKRDVYDTTYSIPAVVSTRNTAATAALLYSLAEENSLAKEERFSTMVNDKADMHFWMNVESLYQGMPGMEALAMLNMSKLYDDSRYAASASFENGQIKVDMTSYAGKEMTEIYKKYSGSNVSADMAGNLPAKEMVAFFAMNFKPEGLKELIKLTGMEGLINMGTAALGFNMDDFIKANKGDILFAVPDFAVDSFGRPQPKVLFAASIGDKASFDKLIAAANKAGAVGGDDIAYNKNDKYFVLGNDKATNDQFISGKGGSKPAFWDKISGGPIAGYVNLQTLMNSMQPKAGRDTFAYQLLQASQKFWKDITLSGGEFKNGGLVQHVEINLADKTTNSLKQINKYIDELALIAKKQKESNPNGVSDVAIDIVDSTTAVPATP